VAQLNLGNPEPRVEPRRLSPVADQGFGQPGRQGDDRSSCLHSGAKIAKSPLRGPFVRPPRVVGQPARDLSVVTLKGLWPYRMDSHARGSPPGAHGVFLVDQPVGTDLVDNRPKRLRGQRRVRSMNVEEMSGLD